MYVCMSVRNGFTIEIYRFTHSLLSGMCHSWCYQCIIVRKTRRIDNEGRLENKARDIEDS